MRLGYVLFVGGLIAGLLLIPGCNCQTDPMDNQHFWMTCVQNPGGGYSPVLTNGTRIVTSSTNFRPDQWSCEDTSGSPAWVGSQASADPPTPVHVTGALRPKAAASSGIASFLPALMLDLPFPARRSGNEATDVTCSPNQPDVLQVNHDNAVVNRIHTCPFQFVASIPVATRPLQVAITPDGSTAIVTSFDSAINFIDLGTNTVTYTLATGSFHPNGIAISPDGAYAYVTSFVPSGATIFKVDLHTRQIVASIPTYQYPQNAVLTPDGEQLYVTAPYANVVVVIDTLTFTQAYAFSLPAPRGIAFNSKGTKAYIALAGNPDNATMGQVDEFDTNNFDISNTYQVGLGPNDIHVLYTDQFVATSNYEGNSISKIDTVTGNVQTVPVNGAPSGLSVVY